MNENDNNFQEPAYPLGEGFELNPEGVWHLMPTGKGNIQKHFICAPLFVLAYARDGRNENYSKLLKFFDPDGLPHTWLMPQELLGGDGSEVRKTLLSKGLRLGNDKKSKDLLVSYLLSCDPDNRVRSIDRTGWYGQSYVLPDTTLGKQTDEKVLYLGPTCTQPIFHTAGTLEQWRNQIALRCVENSRLVFSLSAAFAGSLLGICHEENGGFHLRGASNTGKTTALYVAASLFGGKDYIQKWKATTNGIEAIARMYNDLLLPLDEMGEINPKDAGDVAYMLGNGTGKSRADRSGGARDKAKFRCLFLSTGENSLAQHMLEDGKKAKAGQETRIADIPADLGKYGVFECLHEYTDGASFSNALMTAVRECHGVAGQEYIAKLSEDFEKVRAAVDATIDAFIEDCIPKGSSGQVKRVGRRFGLVAAGGELATLFGITGWQKGAATEAAKTCFSDWLNNRGSDQDLEERNILSKLQHFFESHGESRFAEWKEDPDFKTYNRAGFKKYDGGQVHYYVLPEVFRNEICEGVDWKRAGKIGVDFGFIMPSSDGKSTRTETLPGFGKIRCYRFIRIPVVKEDEEDTDQLDSK
jgi:putative DNA primase/helicase